MYDLILLDGNNFCFRAYYGVVLSTKQGKNTSVAFGMLNMVRSIVQDFNPKQICVCWDYKGSDKKKELYPEYLD